MHMKQCQSRQLNSQLPQDRICSPTTTISSELLRSCHGCACTYIRKVVGGKGARARKFSVCHLHSYIPDGPRRPVPFLCPLGHGSPILERRWNERTDERTNERENELMVKVSKQNAFEVLLARRPPQRLKEEGRLRSLNISVQRSFK